MTKVVAALNSLLTRNIDQESEPEFFEKFTRPGCVPSRNHRIIGETTRGFYLPESIWGDAYYLLALQQMGSFGYKTRFVIGAVS